jgi:mannose-1-phosphate guanylyltransferase
MNASAMTGLSQSERSHYEELPAKSKCNTGPWSIILAGGEGERIKPFVLRWLKRHKPKQYCTFIGTRSMLQHTLARADLLSARERQVTVIKQSHLDDAQPQLADRPRENIILQPSNRDTGPGIFLPLTYVRARDPDAMVIVFPSDHFIHPAGKFASVVAEAVRAAAQSQKLVLLGVAPDSPEPDYGWIVPRKPTSAASQVMSFVEKPGAAEAEAAMSSGGLWNTLVFAVQLKTLWHMGWRCFPEVMRLFERFGEAIGSPREIPLMNEIYHKMPARNFSSGLLSRSIELVSVIRLGGVFWSDWGRPERIAETLRLMQKAPAFPWNCLEACLQTQPL